LCAPRKRVMSKLVMSFVSHVDPRAFVDLAYASVSTLTSTVASSVQYKGHSSSLLDQVLEAGDLQLDGQFEPCVRP